MQATTPPKELTFHAQGVGRPGGTAVLSTRDTLIEGDGKPGPSDTLPGPGDLLGVAFAECALKNAVGFSHKTGFTYEEMTFDISVVKVVNPPHIRKIEYAITVVTDEPDERVDALHENLRSIGTLYNTLIKACEITGEIHVVHPAAAEH
ncbi:MAG: hypothetical protein GWP04_07635 [Gammaproteobacteria bacterium]|nr:hypothetical protein [Gammaproteobacteria bacterium]